MLVTISSIMFNTVLSLEASTILLLSLIKFDVSVSDILVYIKFKGQIYYVLLLESKVQLHSTFRELFPLSTNQQIAPGVNGQGLNEEQIHISKYGFWTSDFKSL